MDEITLHVTIPVKSLSVLHRNEAVLKLAKAIAKYRSWKLDTRQDYRWADFKQKEAIRLGQVDPPTEAL